jgi:hypothetical protein
MDKWCCGMAVFALLSAGGADSWSKPERFADPSMIGPQPDPCHASAIGLCPTAADLARLRSVEGKSQAVVLQTLGHPNRVVRRADGSEVWQYPWMAACEVYVHQGKCTGTFYTGGY